MKLTFLLFLGTSLLLGGPRPGQLTFSCRQDNDLYRALVLGGSVFPRYDSSSEAARRAAPGAGVLILADGYPGKRTDITQATWQTIRTKRLRVFIEYPSFVPGVELELPRKTEWQRTVVSSDVFGRNLPRMRILAIHDCHFLAAQSPKPDLVVARVAGFDSAVYGLPSKDVFPILFEHPDGGILIAATKLSQFITARYAPSEAWPLVWRHILEWANPGGAAPEIRSTPTVRPSFTKTQPLPRDADTRAFERGIAWYENARMLVDGSWKSRVTEARKFTDQVGPPPELRLPSGDGSEGVLEGFNSTIKWDGSQPARWWLRDDCIGETAMAFAISSKSGGSPKRAQVAANLLDFIYFKSMLAQGARSDPQSPSYGLLGWNTTPRYYKDLNGYDVYYGDDNARALLGTMAAAALLRTDRWDEMLMRTLLANFRTTGKLGFRDSRIDEGPLQKHGWQYYYNSDAVNYSPHFDAYLWACLLWAHQQTGYEPFLARTKNAIRMTMEAYPNNWRWTNGIQQERARMLLPLAWLIRIEDTAEHRAWLHRMASDMLRDQDSSGAIREEIGNAGKGSYGPPKTNEAYGTHESALIQQNGDPLADLLYTTNFAFLGLNEAAAATGEAEYSNAAKKLAGFLVRAQVRSQAHPELDGAWFRAFEFRRWEYWASNADAGWGAWSTETGWTQAWITSVLGLRHLKTSLWDLSRPSGVKRHFDRLLNRMIPASAR